MLPVEGKIIWSPCQMSMIQRLPLYSHLHFTSVLRVQCPSHRPDTHCAPVTPPGPKINTLPLTVNSTAVRDIQIRGCALSAPEQMDTHKHKNNEVPPNGAPSQRADRSPRIGKDWLSLCHLLYTGQFISFIWLAVFTPSRPHFSHLALAFPLCWMVCVCVVLLD